MSCSLECSLATCLHVLQRCPAAHFLPFAEGCQRRLLLNAAVLAIGAAGVKAASSHRLTGVDRLTGYAHERLVGRLVEPRNGSQQTLGVGVSRTMEDLASRRALHHPA